MTSKTSQANPAVTVHSLGSEVLPFAEMATGQDSSVTRKGRLNGYILPSLLGCNAALQFRQQPFILHLITDVTHRRQE